MQASVALFLLSAVAQALPQGTITNVATLTDAGPEQTGVITTTFSPCDYLPSDGSDTLCNKLVSQGYKPEAASFLVNELEGNTAVLSVATRAVSATNAFGGELGLFTAFPDSPSGVDAALAGVSTLPSGSGRDLYSSLLKDVVVLQGNPTTSLSGFGGPSTLVYNTGDSSSSTKATNGTLASTTGAGRTSGGPTPSTAAGGASGESSSTTNSGSASSSSSHAGAMPKQTGLSLAAGMAAGLVGLAMGL